MIHMHAPNRKTDVGVHDDVQTFDIIPNGQLYCIKCVPPKKTFYCCLYYPCLTVKGEKDETRPKDQFSDAAKTPTFEENTNAHNRSTIPAATAMSTFGVAMGIKPNVKFTLKQARTVDSHSLSDHELKSAKQIPDYILKNLMIVNYHAREFKIKVIKPSKHTETDNSDDSDESDDDDNNTKKRLGGEGINPLDGLLWVFHCSDDILRRYLTVKLSQCQLSVPFLLPDPSAPSDNVTILLSALENVTKSWKSANASHDDVSGHQVFATEHPFPVVSLIRMGENTISKSFLINRIMCDEIGDHDIFFHKDIQGGDVKRKVVDGLVELSWYLPGGNESQTLKSEICFANLRGDARFLKKQLDVLLKISSVICILLPSECPNETLQTTILKAVTNNNSKIIIIFDKKRRADDARQYFKDLKQGYPGKVFLLTRETESNEYDFLQSIRKNIQKHIHEVKATPLRELVSYANEYEVNLDGDPSSHLGVRKSVETWLKRGIQEAKDLFKLQMHIPKLAELERETYCPKRRGNVDQFKHVIDEIDRDITEEQKAQKESFKQLDKSIVDYLHSIAVMNTTERQAALNGMKHQLDKMSLQNMAKLHQEYRVTTLNLQKKSVETHLGESNGQLSDEEHLKQLEEAITKSSFGLEHIIRELAQLHQLQLLLNISKYDYAGAAAEMLLSGQVLELLDGDSSYIPLEWFEAVYTQVERKTNNAKIFVISVLGIQSSGKSTLLNTMFGLEFPVSAGRCTRGAFVSLIPLGDSLRTDSHFDYLLIVDTEGLKGSADPQLREHDNQLASFVIGVADLAIVNIFGENHNEIKDFLEITVHAFLKMKLVKEKKYCKIVHQNVAAADATEKLTTDRVRLKRDLDKMAKLAATQENCENKCKGFDYIISFDENKDVFYIPSLLAGSPPMAPVNPDYGKAVQKVKENIISVMRSRGHQISFSQFRERVINLWKAILKENFIFNFRNTIEVRAYTSLNRKYFEISVNLLATRMAELESEIQVALKICETQDELEKKYKESDLQIRKLAEAIREGMQDEMRNFFETSEDKATLEQWRESVMNKIEQSVEDQLREIRKNLSAALRYWQNLQDAVKKKENYKKELLQKAKKFITGTDELKKSKAAFEQEWQEWIADVPPCQEVKRDVNTQMVNVLSDSNPALNVEMRQKLARNEYFIFNFKEIDPVIDNNNLSISDWSWRDNFTSDEMREISQATENALDFAKDTSKSRVRYTYNHLTQMYHKVITTIENATEKSSFKLCKSLKCDILLYTFANALEIFDEMEESYVQERDIRVFLEKEVKPKLKEYFVDIWNKIEKEVADAKHIASVLKEPIRSELNRVMGSAVAKEIRNSTSKYQSKAQFHASVLIEFGKQGKFGPYIPYLANPVKVLKAKLIESVEDSCLKHAHASVNLLLKNEINRIKNKVFGAISTASKLTKETSGNLTFWIQHFVKAYPTLGIKNSMFSISVDVINDKLEEVDVFESKITEDVTEILESLIKCGVNHETIREWDPAPHDYLLSMFGCQHVCPFCRALCDQTVKNHPGDHFTQIHRPQGVTGYRDHTTQILVISICTADVASERRRFYNLDTSGEWHNYKDYQSVNDYYKSWSIPPDPSFEASTYWQWFVATFSKELAEHYGVKQPDIPEAWKKHTFTEIECHLRQQYNM